MEEMELGNSEEKLRNMKVKEPEDFVEAMEPANDDEESPPLMAIENEDSDNNDDEEDDDDLDDDVAEKEVKQLEGVLLENPYDYATHLSIISKLQSMGELDRLRIARENMSSKYPLSPEIWLSWLRDEIKLVSNSEDRQAVEKLCERAVKDYFSIDIWLEYLQFNIGAMGGDKDKDPKNTIRQLFERALTAGGLHVTKGAIIWEAYREFENVLVSMATSDVERKDGIDRIASLFRRQLACPLLDMEKALEEYLEWRSSDGSDASVDDTIVTANYKRASTELTSRLPFEDRLLACQDNNELTDVYKAYLNYEKQHGDPGRVCVLYERTLSDLSLESQFWIDYLDYVASTIKDETILSSIYERATRNVPWCSKIWKSWIRSLEKWKKPLLTIQNILENALVAGFSSADDYRTIWMAYLEYLRRRIEPSSSNVKQQTEVIENAFNKACEHLAKLFGLDGDPQCVILQYWARTEAIHVSDMEKARSIWSDILSQGHSIYAASWLEYISLEKCYGDTKHLRKLYQKALVAVKDWPESITNSWLEFERDEGDLEQIEICENKIKEKLDKIAEERLKNSNQANYGQDANTSYSSEKKTMKRKGDDAGRWQGPAGKQGKIDKFKKLKIDDGTVNVDKTKKIIEEKKVAPPPGYVPPQQGEKIAPPPGYVPPKEDNKTSKIPPPPGYIPPQDDEKMDTSQEVDDKITVFISNLDYDATEEEVRAALAAAGPITLFKMVKDFKGRSKGFCYVQLTSTQAVDEALKLDRTPVNGRPMFVSRCDPDKTTRGPGFKYACALEKNKLFVKGLPTSTTKEDLEKLFSKYGTVKDVRLVTYRNGHSKGLAYVDFDDEKSAGKAVLATDNMSIGDKVISVAISAPPERRKKIEDTPVKSLGGTAVSRSQFGGPRLMIPRSVKPQTNNESSLASSTSTPSEVKPMNNQDFRNMLLNKK